MTALERLETVAKVSLMAAQLLGWPTGPVLKSAGPHSKLSFFSFSKSDTWFHFCLILDQMDSGGNPVKRPTNSNK